jgi:hypothetical protein
MNVKFRWTHLILDIFYNVPRLYARTQVELAQCIIYCQDFLDVDTLERQKEELECVDLERQDKTDRRIVRDRILLKR